MDSHGIGNWAADSDATAYVRALFEGLAVRQDALRASNDTTAIRASNANSKMLLEALRTSFSS